MPEMIDADGNIILLGDRLARIDPDTLAVCVLPLSFGTPFETKPQSPLYYDSASHFRSIQVDNPDGVISVRFWRSASSDSAANQTLIEQAIIDKQANPAVVIPQPIMTNHKWIPLTNIEYGLEFGIGLSEVPRHIIDGARMSRWLKIDPIFGPYTTTNFWPQFAGQ